MTSRLAILIVDDNNANLRILGATFEDSGFAIHAASSVEEAQEILKAKMDEIDLVLSDIQMPGLSGFDLVKWMKDEDSTIRNIPVLLITSQLPEAENRIFGLSLGAIDYLPRSLDLQELVLKVSHAVENYSQIKNLRKSLETTENLASTGRLFAASNHEIKNVTQIIRMATGILERELSADRYQLSETSKQALGMLQRSSNLLGDVTKLIGGLVNNQNAPMATVDLVTLIDQVASMIRPLLKNQVEFRYQAHREPVLVAGSATFIKQILINLILNARDAIQEVQASVRGKIEVDVDTTKDQNIVLTVTDNGIGFAGEVRNQFQAFSSTKQLRGGTGLGLWLSSHLAQKMAGTLTLESEGIRLGAKATVSLKRAT
jgi:signal transduction histidine kinase